MLNKCLLNFCFSNDLNTLSACVYFPQSAEVYESHANEIDNISIL